ncbi:Uncharacterised protein [Mycobacteroides abscessus subsp. abscessus]|nr:Uncharacterised protein [Mycobacteroides abscessus subsp. abscessus]
MISPALLRGLRKKRFSSSTGFRRVGCREYTGRSSSERRPVNGPCPPPRLRGSRATTSVATVCA